MQKLAKIFKSGSKKCFKLSLIALLLWANLGFLPGTVITGLAQIIPLPEEPYKNTFVVGSGDTALEKTESVVGKVVGQGRLLLAAVAILLGITGAVQLLVSEDKDEGATKAKQIILYSVVGFAIIALSSDLGKIFDLSGGGLLGNRAELNERLQIFDNTIRIVITFIKYLLGSVAILMLVITGLRLVTNSDQEDEVGKNKKNIMYILGGLFALLFVDTFIRNVFYKIDAPGEDLTIDLGQGITELVSFTNFIVSWVGPIAILTFVAGGAMYVFAFGDEEQQGTARKMMTASLIGIVFIFGAFGIVSTVITGRL